MDYDNIKCGECCWSDFTFKCIDEDCSCHTPSESMTNNTKTLEEIKKEFGHVCHPTVAEKVWNAALDACRENIQSMEEKYGSYQASEESLIHHLISKEEAIDSLRPLGGKE